MNPPYWKDGTVALYVGDCLDVLAGMEAASIDVIVTDPPYGLEFMGAEWDGANGFRRSLNPADAERDSVFGRASRTGPEYRTAAGWKHGFAETGYSDAKRMPRPNFGSSRNPMCMACHKHQRGTDRCICAEPEFDERPADSNNLYQEWCTVWAAECLRVLKPGGFMLAFGGTRTWHRLACAIEDAGFEIRDSIDWIYGQGFPKNHNVSKAIDKAAGAERQVVSERAPVKRMIPGADQNRTGSWIKDNGRVFVPQETQPATPEAAQWEGWGVALKPAHEPIVVARKPLAGTVAANVLEYGTGALNIDGCRVGHASPDDLAASQAKNPGRADTATSDVYGANRPQQSVNDAGRWPPNLVLSHSPDCQPTGLREVRSDGHHPAARGRGGLSTSGHAGQEGLTERKSDTETVEAWHCAQGCPVGELNRQSSAASRFFHVFRYQAKAAAHERPRLEDGTAHPTVKPVDLMAWLVRLVTPPGGTVLDPFAGTGTTAEACIVEGFRCVLIDKDPKAAELIRVRLRKDIQPAMFGEVS